MEKKQVSAQMNFEMAKSLEYSYRKTCNRIELPISEAFFDRCHERYSIGCGRFKPNIQLENYLKLIKNSTYCDGYSVEIELLLFRVQKSKVVNINGQDYKSCPKLIAKYIRHGEKPTIE